MRVVLDTDAFVLTNPSVSDAVTWRVKRWIKNEIYCTPDLKPMMRQYFT